MERVPTSIDETFSLLEAGLQEHPEMKLVVVDHISKFLRVSDINDYSQVQVAVKRLRDLAVSHGVHIMALAHCKKTVSDDQFDSLLGSTALRGESDANIAMFIKDGSRCIQAEVRRGKQLPATILKTEMQISGLDGAEIVSGYELAGTLDDWKASQTQKREEKRTVDFESRVITFLKASDGPVLQKALLDGVEGKAMSKLDALKTLETLGVIKRAGTPLTIALNSNALQLWNLSNLSSQVVN